MANNVNRPLSPAVETDGFEISELLPEQIFELHTVSEHTYYGAIINLMDRWIVLADPSRRKIVCPTAFQFLGSKSSNSAELSENWIGQGYSLHVRRVNQTHKGHTNVISAIKLINDPRRANDIIEQAVEAAKAERHQRADDIESLTFGL